MIQEPGLQSRFPRLHRVSIVAFVLVLMTGVACTQSSPSRGQAQAEPPRVATSTATVAAPSTIATASSVIAAAPDNGIRFDKQSKYTRVMVIDREGKRCLKFGSEAGLVQSCMVISAPERPVYEYVKHLAAGLLFRPEPQTGLMIGLGGGSGVRMLQRAVPGLHLDVVELDPVVIEAATGYFGIERSPRLNLIEGDGRRYLERTQEKWDTIFLDAFDEKFIPFSLATVEFQRLVKAHLKPHGAMVSNLWRTNEPLFRAMVKTMREVFPSLHVFDTKDGNTIVVGTMDRENVSKADLVKRASERAKTGQFDFDLGEVPRGYSPIGAIPLDVAPILVDGHPEVMSGFGEP